MPRPLRLFISYAHFDFRPVLGGETTRAEQIYLLIRNALKIGGPGSRFETLRDQENFLAPGQTIETEIEAAIRASDGAIVFLSPSYLESEWCRSEYLKLLKLGKFIQVVELESVRDLTDLHEEAQRILAHVEQNLTVRFWDEHPMGGLDVLLGFPFLNTEKPDFEIVAERCRGIAKALGKHALATQLSEGDLARFHNLKKSNSEKPEHDVKVTLLATTQDAEQHYRRLSDRLSEEGYDVSQTTIDPTAADLENRLQNACAESTLLIQILGDVEGREIPATNESQAFFQHRIATESGKPLVCWRAGTVPLEELGRDYRKDLESFSLHETDFGGLQTYILKALEQATLRHRLAKERFDQSEPYVVLDGDASDSALLNSLRDFLAEEEAAVTIIPFDDGKQMQHDLAEAAEVNDGAVLIFGPERASQKRANRHFNELRKHIHTADKQTRRLQSMAIGNSAAAGAAHPAAKEVQVLRLYDQFNVDEVRGFLSRVRETMSKQKNAQSD